MSSTGPITISCNLRLVLKLVCILFTIQAVVQLMRKEFWDFQHLKLLNVNCQLQNLCDMNDESSLAL